MIIRILQTILLAGVMWGTFKLLDYWWKNRQAKKETKNLPVKQRKPDATVYREKLESGKVREVYEKDGQRIEMIKDEEDKPVKTQKEVQLANANVVQHFEFS